MSSVGVDIGGTTTELVRVADDGHVEAHAIVPTEPGAGLVSGTIDAVRALVVGGSLDRIGVGVPGQVDPDPGTVRFAVNLGLDAEPVALGSALDAEFGVPVEVENDVRAAALGAHRHLRPDAEVLAFLGIGTGVSAGVVIGGELHRGRDGMAGEIGHVSVDPDGPVCSCGLSGCVEALISGPAIRRRWDGGGDGPAAAELFTAAARGDAAAQVIATEVTDHLVRTVQWVALAYGADLVVLGGGVGSVGGPLLAAVHQRLREMAQRSNVVGHLLGEQRVTSAPADLPVGALGAAELARRAGSRVRVGETAVPAAGRERSGLVPASDVDDREHDHA